MTASTDIVLAMCRDEEDIIEPFIRFHLDMGFDAVYIVDNASTDRTAQILRALAAEGLPLIWRHDDRLGHERTHTEHYRWAGRDAAARWLFYLDVDEFLPIPGRVKPYLSRVPAGICALRVRQRQMYQPTEPAGPHRWPFLLTTAGSRSLDQEPSKVVTRFHPGARVYAGKHRIDLPGGREHLAEDLIIRHYKFRSRAQARRKLANQLESIEACSDADLARIAAFPGAAVQAWRREIHRQARQESWQDWFTASVPFVPDDAVARWSAGH